jgi:hypothetical protein
MISLISLDLFESDNVLMDEEDWEYPDVISSSSVLWQTIVSTPTNLDNEIDNDFYNDQTFHLISFLPILLNFFIFNKIEFFVFIIPFEIFFFFNTIIIDLFGRFILQTSYFYFIDYTYWSWRVFGVPDDGCAYSSGETFNTATFFNDSIYDFEYLLSHFIKLKYHNLNLFEPSFLFFFLINILNVFNILFFSCFLNLIFFFDYILFLIYYINLLFYLLILFFIFIFFNMLFAFCHIINDIY